MDENNILIMMSFVPEEIQIYAYSCLYLVILSKTIMENIKNV